MFVADLLLGDVGMLKALLRERPGSLDGGSGRSDASFNNATVAGDRFRDARDWASAEAAYATALSVRPGEGGYWVQHAHMLKEQERFADAERSYRTALANGAPVDDVLEHLQFVMRRQEDMKNSGTIVASTLPSAKIEVVLIQDFREAVARGDRLRDACDWAAAQAAYAMALALCPGEQGYWTQHGHVCKEQGLFGDAEVSYRTALALGAPLDDVAASLQFVLSAQALSVIQHPIRMALPCRRSGRLPSRPNVLALARMLWGAALPSEHDLLVMMRLPSIDEVFAAMVADDRFRLMHIDWLSFTVPGEL